MNRKPCKCITYMICSTKNGSQPLWSTWMVSRTSSPSVVRVASAIQTKITRWKWVSWQRAASSKGEEWTLKTSGKKKNTSSGDSYPQRNEWDADLEPPLFFDVCSIDKAGHPLSVSLPTGREDVIFLDSEKRRL